uniref:Candidate secreted effector n=1 Tax=Meloidogyne incognita TaxID=6306 RepID=A0A914NFF6_MELIC
MLIHFLKYDVSHGEQPNLPRAQLTASPSYRSPTHRSPTYRQTNSSLDVELTPADGPTSPVDGSSSPFDG